MKAEVEREKVKGETRTTVRNSSKNIGIILIKLFLDLYLLSIMVSHIVIPLIIIAVVIAALILTGQYADPIVAIPSMVIVGFISYRIGYVIYKTRRRNFFSYVGKIGKATENIPIGGEGYIMIEGEMWKAIAEDQISEGDKVIVIRMEGLKLRVKKYSENGKN